MFFARQRETVEERPFQAECKDVMGVTPFRATKKNSFGTMRFGACRGWPSGFAPFLERRKPLLFATYSPILLIAEGYSVLLRGTSPSDARRDRVHILEDEVALLRRQDPRGEIKYLMLYSDSVWEANLFLHQEFPQSRKMVKIGSERELREFFDATVERLCAEGFAVCPRELTALKTCEIKRK